MVELVVDAGVHFVNVSLLFRPNLERAEQLQNMPIATRSLVSFSCFVSA
eukprot:SAG31_NODE_28075_length_415_cov_14.398734_2_plen_48_part_01